MIGQLQWFIKNSLPLASTTYFHSKVQKRIKAILNDFWSISFPNIHWWKYQKTFGYYSSIKVTGSFCHLKTQRATDAHKNSTTNESNYSIVDQVTFVEGSLWKIWRGMVCFNQTIPLQIFQRLSSTNFTWSIPEYFVPNQPHNSSTQALTMDTNNTLISQ